MATRLFHKIANTLLHVFIYEYCRTRAEPMEANMGSGPLALQLDRLTVERGYPLAYAMIVLDQ